MAIYFQFKESKPRDGKLLFIKTFKGQFYQARYDSEPNHFLLENKANDIITTDAENVECWKYANEKGMI